MKVMLSETVTHFHEIELSDELDIEQILDMANALKKRYDTGHEAIVAVLEAYKNKFDLDYKVKPNACGTEFENLEFEYFIEE